VARRAWACGAIAVALAVAPAAGVRAELLQQRGDPSLYTREFPVRHQNPESLAKVLWPLGSGENGTFVEGHKKKRMLTVRDDDAHLAAIEKALRGLDVPSPPRPEIFVSVRFLVATDVPDPKLAPEIARVVAPLRAQLRVKGFAEIANPDDDIESGEGNRREGRVEYGPAFARRARWSLRLEDVTWRPALSGKPATVSVGRLKIWTEGEAYGKAELATSLSARDGQPVVVGTVPLKATTLVLVLTARRK
jgi:hypothetical protein